MSDLGKEGLSPVARFSLALGAVLAATAIALSAVTSYLVSRYVAGPGRDIGKHNRSCAGVLVVLRAEKHELVGDRIAAV